MNDLSKTNKGWMVISIDSEVAAELRRRYPNMSWNNRLRALLGMPPAAKRGRKKRALVGV